MSNKPKHANSSGRAWNRPQDLGRNKAKRKARAKGLRHIGKAPRSTDGIEFRGRPNPLRLLLAFPYDLFAIDTGAGLRERTRRLGGAEWAAFKAKDRARRGLQVEG